MGRNVYRRPYKLLLSLFEFTLNFKYNSEQFCVIDKESPYASWCQCSLVVCHPYYMYNIEVDLVDYWIGAVYMIYQRQQLFIPLAIICTDERSILHSNENSRTCVSQVIY